MPTNVMTYISRNQNQPCAVRECREQRNSVSRFCVRHQETRRLYGVPHGRRIRRKEYQQELKAVTQLITKGIETNHPAITEAVKVVDGWLDAATRGFKVYAASDIRRLHSKDVTAQEILAEGAATWLYFRRNPHLDDTLQLIYAIGTNVLYLATRNVKPNGTPKAVTGTARKECGTFIKDYFTPLFINIEKRLKADKQANIDAVEALRIPL